MPTTRLPSTTGRPEIRCCCVSASTCAHRHRRRDRDRILDHAAFEALDLRDFGGLPRRRHVLVHDADAAFLRDGDREARFGDRVHRRGQQRDVQRDRAGEAGYEAKRRGEGRVEWAGTSRTSSNVSALRTTRIELSSVAKTDYTRVACDASRPRAYPATRQRRRAAVRARRIRPIDGGAVRRSNLPLSYRRQGPTMSRSSLTAFAACAARRDVGGGPRRRRCTNGPTRRAASSIPTSRRRPT